MRTLVLSAAILACTTVAQAQTAHPLSEGGRYQLMEVNEKIVRLDTQTGAFDLCRMEPGGWNCQMAEHERQALEQRVSQLESRLAQLETQLLAERAAKVQAEAQAQADAKKGIVSRLSGFVPEIGW